MDLMSIENNPFFTQFLHLSSKVLSVDGMYGTARIHNALCANLTFLVSAQLCLSIYVLFFNIIIHGIYVSSEILCANNVDSEMIIYYIPISNKLMSLCRVWTIVSVA